MCGIVGLIGLLSKARIKMFEEMLAIDAVRGVDSTGIAVVNKTGVHTVKDIVLPGTLLLDEDYRLAVKAEPFVLLGHNRAATKGSVTAENAHPFTKKHITLVHNGTLNCAWRLPAHEKYETDSEAIADCIAEYGIEATWKVIDGAATLVWWDEKEESLNTISNGMRPFYVQPLKDYTALAWASERWMMKAAAKRHGVSFEDDKVYMPDKHHLQTFTWNAGKNRFEYEEHKLQHYVFGNHIPGYDPYYPDEKKKKKKGGKTTSTYGEPFKSAKESANVFATWKEESLRKLDGLPPSDKYSDANMRKEYSELFDKPPFDMDKQLPLPLANGTDADLDTRGVPFQKNTRTVQRFSQLFNLTELNAKYYTAEWFLATFKGCCDCGESFDYSDYFTAKQMSGSAALCADCQCDVWVTSGVTPDQLRRFQ